MRQSFEGFLMQYCQELTGLDSRSLKRFFAEALDESPRVAEPLLLLALTQHREAYLMRLARGSRFERGYVRFIDSFLESNDSLEAYLASGIASSRYKKIYASYLSKEGRLDRDREVLESLVPQVNTLLHEKGVSKYQVMKDLGLNKGNYYAFLKGDASKMSREKAFGIYEYLVTIEDAHSSRASSKRKNH